VGATHLGWAGGGGGGGTATAIAVYIGAPAAVRHSSMSLPTWPTADTVVTTVEHDGRLPWGLLPATDCWRPPYLRGSRRLEVLQPWPTTTAVAHGGWLPNPKIFQTNV
jgi:hypothetical protein